MDAAGREKAQRAVPPSRNHIAAAFSADGETFAAWSGGTPASVVRLYRLPGGEELRELNGLTGTAYFRTRPPSPPTAISLAGGRDRKILMWETDSGIPGEAVRVRRRDLALAVSPDGLAR